MDADRMSNQKPILSYGTARPRRRILRDGLLIFLLVLLSLLPLAIVLSANGGPRINPAIARTKITLKQLEVGFKEVVISAGSSPASMTEFLRQASLVPSARRILDGLPTATDAAGRKSFLDGWDHPIRYVPPTAGRPACFQSAGPNGTFDDADDICSYDP
jgi:hypothetical protein